MKTGIKLSPYFTAAKLAWIFQNIAGVSERSKAGEIAVETIDSWLVYKLTNGTGSSIMINTDEKPVFSEAGIVTSLAWKIGGKVNYVLEGNINYTGAVIT